MTLQGAVQRGEKRVIFEDVSFLFPLCMWYLDKKSVIPPSPKRDSDNYVYALVHVLVFRVCRLKQETKKLLTYRVFFRRAQDNP